MIELATAGFAAAWTWAIILVFVTIGVHFAGLASLSLSVPRFWRENISGRNSFWDTIPGTWLIMTTIAFLLAVLHGFEAVLWAIAYLRLGVLSSMADALLYSFGAMSTGGSGLNVEVRWRIMAAIESFDGVLLFGITTAYLFASISALWKAVANRRGVEPDRSQGVEKPAKEST